MVSPRGSSRVHFGTCYVEFAESVLSGENSEDRKMLLQIRKQVCGWDDMVRSRSGGTGART